MKRRLPLFALLLCGSAYFLLTAARDLQPFDSSEFALNAAQLGVGHPPGQPLYLILGAALVRLLPFSPSFSLVLISIAATVATAAITLRLGARAAGPVWIFSKIGGLLAALAVGGIWLVPGVWDFGTRAEVYPLAALLIVGATALVVLSPAQAPALRLSSSFFLFGLAASVNPAMTVVGFLAATPALIALARRLGLRKALRAFAASGAAGLLGLSPYLVLPLLGAHPRDAIVWGEPLAGRDLLRYLTGGDYRAWRIGAGEYLDNLAVGAGWLVDQGMLPWIGLGTVGLLLSGLPRAARAIPLIGALLSLLLLAANHPFIPSNPDYAGYLLPPLWIASAGVAAGLLQCSKQRGAALALAAVALVGLWAAGALAGPPIASRDRYQSHFTRALAKRLLDEAPAGAIVLLESDHLVFPCLYLQEVEHVRPDVAVLNVGWASSSWYWRHVAARHPELPSPPVAPSREARVAGLLEAAGRSVALEHGGLAPGARIGCARGLLTLVGTPCPAGSPSDPPSAGPAPIGDPAGTLGLGEGRPRAGSLDERLLAHTAVVRTDELWRAGELERAWEVLRSGVGPERMAGLPPAAPHFFTTAGARELTLGARTPLVEPRALLPPGVALLRMGNLVEPFDPAAAAAYYARAAIPESDLALARLRGIGR